jgi:hypothetical protein
MKREREKQMESYKKAPPRRPSAERERERHQINRVSGEGYVYKGRACAAVVAGVQVAGNISSFRGKSCLS